VISGLDWDLLQETPFVFVGGGAVGRPLAMSLAYMGMRQCVIVDPKPYKAQSRVSQCEGDEVGRDKAMVMADQLRLLDVDATALVEDIDDVPPGYVPPGAVVITSVDNRRADVCTGRLAARMRVRLIKANVAPEYLMASVRAYDLRPERPALCLECQWTDDQYKEQRHPRSCDGDGIRPTGSPRALCQFAADAAALIAAQIVGSPDQLAHRWFGRQWQQMILAGNGFTLQLTPKVSCRWDHGEHWRNLIRLSDGPHRLSLNDLVQKTPMSGSSDVHVRVSGRIAVWARCGQCHAREQRPRWVSRLDRPVSQCGCRGPLTAEPFFSFHDCPAETLRAVWNRPLHEWGVPAQSVIAIEAGGHQWSFVIGQDRGAPNSWPARPGTWA